MGKYPVFFNSLKDVEGMDYQTAYDMLGSVVSEEARRFKFLLESNRRMEYEKEQLVCLMRGDFRKKVYLQNSLRLLFGDGAAHSVSWACGCVLSVGCDQPM